MLEYLFFIAAATAARSVPGFLSHFQPETIESLVDDHDFVSSEQHTLATPVPTPPAQGAASVAPYVDRFAVPDDVRKVYTQAWDQQQKLSASPMHPSPSAVDQLSMHRLYGYPLDWPFGASSFPSEKHFHNSWGLPAPYFPPMPTFPRMQQYGNQYLPSLAQVQPAPAYAQSPQPSHVVPESENPSNFLYQSLSQGPRMASHIGDSLGSQMGSSLGSTLATDLNLLQGLTNSAAQNFFNVFNGQFQKAQPVRLLSGLTGGLSLPSAVTSTATTSVVTARPAAEVWNEAIESLQEQAASLSLPSLANFNASLPLIETVGSGSELSAITSHTGSNLGSTVGSTLGNTIASTTDLWKALLTSASSGFIEAIAPSVSELATMFAEQAAARRLEEQAQSGNGNCTELGTVYDSPFSVTFNDVPTRKTCNLICQLYSTPAIITGEMDNCYSQDDWPCLWTSYSLVSHRCTLLFSLANQHQMEGFVSDPVYCPGQTFLQTNTALSNLDAMGCNITAIKSNIVTVVDSAKPPAPQASQSAVEIPEFPDFFNPEADSQSIWKYNPDLPLNEKGNFEEDVIYQVGYGISNPLEAKVWGQATGVKDWRSCVYLCQQDSDCSYWTYHFDPLTYNTRYGSCVLASNKEPKGQALSRVKTISGGRLSTFSTDLFGSVFSDNVTEVEEAHLRKLYVADSKSRSWIPINKAPPRRLSESGSALLPTVVSTDLLKAYGLQDAKYMATEEPAPTSSETKGSCRDFGFAYYLPGSTNGTLIQDATYSSLATTADDCDLVCRSTTNCVAYQFVPKQVIAASTTLASIQNTPCILLSSFDMGAHVSVPSMVSGLASPGGDVEACVLNDKPSLPTVASVAMKTAEVSQSGDSSTVDLLSEDSASEIASLFGKENTSCVDKKGESHAFAAGVSIRGELLKETPNILRGLGSASDCHTACTEYAECTAFTWGAWQGCYLLQTVEAFVTDSSTQVVSGYADCEENSARDLKSISTKARILEEETPRQLTTCAKAYKGLVYSKGSIIAKNSDVESADDCWKGCRSTEDCFYMTYLSVPGNETSASRQMCIWYDQVAASEAVQTHLSTSAESNCDVLGDLAFESAWAMSRVMRSVNIPAITSATVGGVVVLLGGIFAWRRTKSNDEASPSDRATTEGGDQSTLNAFGMRGSSLSMSPGAVERGSPALQLDDFEKVEPHVDKSTSKRLRRYF